MTNKNIKSQLIVIHNPNIKSAIDVLKPNKSLDA